MWSFLSKVFGGKGNEENQETERRLNAEKDRRTRAHATKQAREEEEEKRKIDEKINKERQEEMKRSEEEIEKEKKRELERVKKNQEGYNEDRIAGEKKLAEIQKEINSKNEMLVEEAKKNGLERTKSEKEKLQKDKELLVEQEKKMKEGLNGSIKLREEMLTERAKITKEFDEENKKNRDKHQEKLLKVQKETSEEVLKVEQEINEEEKELKEFQLVEAKKRNQLLALQMDQAHSLLDAHNKEQSFEDFRRNCNNLIRLYNRAKTNFNNEENSLIRTRDDIEHSLELKCPPDFDRVGRSLNSLNEALLAFNVDGAVDQQKYESLQNDVNKLVEQLIRTINSIGSNIDGYRSAFTGVLQEQVPPVPMEKPSENEEFDVLTASSTKSSTPTLERRSNGNSVDTGNYSIGKLYEEATNIIKDISNLMLNFNVRALPLFEDRLARNSEQLALRHSSNQNAQITNGQSTSASSQNCLISQLSEEVDKDE